MTQSRGPVPPPAAVTLPEPDLAAKPDGYVVLVAPQDRVHFLDWIAPAGSAGAQVPARGDGVLLIHGLAATAQAWTPVARRLCGARKVVAMDLRGHGLSDAPTDGYDLATLGADAVAVVEGAGLLDEPGSHVVLAGHGFGAIVAAQAALALGDRCGALVLVDGGWEALAEASGQDAEEFLRTLEEPPEVLSSLAAYLADRKAFDPPSWDADQEEAARAAVVELPAGRVVSATRPHALQGSVRAMFEYRPEQTLAGVTAPIRVLSAAEDEAHGRSAALDGIARRLAAAGRPLQGRRAFPSDGHNLMRYRPGEVVAAILGTGW